MRIEKIPPYKYWESETAEFLRKTAMITMFVFTIMSALSLYEGNLGKAVRTGVLASGVAFTIGVADLFLKKAPPLP